MSDFLYIKIDPQPDSWPEMEMYPSFWEETEDDETQYYVNHIARPGKEESINVYPPEVLDYNFVSWYKTNEFEGRSVFYWVYIKNSAARITLSEEAWNKFIEELNSPPKINPKLKALLEQPSVFDEDEE